MVSLMLITIALVCIAPIVYAWGMLLSIFLKPKRIRSVTNGTNNPTKATKGYRKK